MTGTAALLFLSLLTPCRPAGVNESVLCGTVTVPESRAVADGRTIALNVVVLPSLSKEKKEPLFELAGGPGIAATSSAALYASELRAYRQHRDVVLVDQRGTGKSNGLHCRDDESRRTGEMYPRGYVERCRDELQRNADLAAYTTDAAADDLDAVRAALGYDRIHLLGLSYGTRLALVYARRHPDGVASLVLAGATPAWASIPLFHAANGQRALDLLFDDCAADAKCASRYGDLRAKFQGVVTALRAKPAKISADVFAERIRSLLYLPATSRAIPKIVDSAARGDFALLLERARTPSTEGDGLYLSITCSEDVPFIDDAKMLTAGTYFGDYRVREQRRACEWWPARKADARFRDDVTSDVPALLIAGYRDPVTPPAWAYAVAGHLPNATVLLVPHSAHLPIGLSGLECWDALVMKFLDGEALTDADRACVTKMTPPPFE